MRRRMMVLCASVVILAGCGGLFHSSPLAATCSQSCYNLEPSAQTECLSRCNKGR